MNRNILSVIALLASGTVVAADVDVRPNARKHPSLQVREINVLQLGAYQSGWVLTEEDGWKRTKAFMWIEPPTDPSAKCFGRRIVPVRLANGNIWVNAWVFDVARARWIRANVAISGWEPPKGPPSQLKWVSLQPIKPWPVDSAGNSGGSIKQGQEERRGEMLPGHSRPERALPNPLSAAPDQKK